ncbi:hypothetical protein TNCV_1513561 [Trichonephila clavipes]|nr:hypothetical protein TNCV_1513561 [Trichonephila clavipes]
MFLAKPSPKACQTETIYALKTPSRIFEEKNVDREKGPRIPKAFRALFPPRKSPLEKFLRKLLRGVGVSPAEISRRRSIRSS